MISSRDIVEITISIHAPTRGATSQAFAFVQAMSYFNPRSYKRSDQLSRKLILFASYFNPRSYKRSDSRTSSKYDRSDFISIHAPTRGATTSFAATICKLRLFQSTLLQEERLGADIMFLCSDNISIHAPTRGATRFRFRDNISTFYFNPRSYKRSDFLVDAAAQQRFNFNPRSYKRSDVVFII